MADQQQLALLRKHGVGGWNRSRREHPDVRADLSAVELTGAALTGIDLVQADLTDADFSGATLTGADLSGANLAGATLAGARLNGACLVEANLCGANFADVQMSGANLSGATLIETNMAGARLVGAIFDRATILDADLSGADLTEASLQLCSIVKSNLNASVLRGCHIFGISAWNVSLERATQSNLIITPDGEPSVELDNLEVAQFIYLLLNNRKIREVIDAVTSKVVLILGRFSPARKAVLESIREELRRRNYIPVLFDFDKPTNRDVTETVSTLAHMSRFIIADLTDAKSIPQELTRIVPNLPSVPVQPVLLASEREWGMYETFPRYPWVLPIARYEDRAALIADIAEKVIGPAEQKALEQIMPPKR